MKRFFLELKNISKTFPGVKALDNVRFDIYPGEVHSLVGENGAGKSTLIKIITGVYQPDKGSEIFIEGKKVSINSVIDSIRMGISVIYQDFSLFSNLTVAENIMINQLIERKSKLVNWNRIIKKSQDALNIIKSDINPREKVENLSIAKQQMVAIAGAVAQNSKMIIMDEPTSALSRSEIDNLYTIIDRLVKKNIAVMFVSHKMDELFRLSDRFTVFRDGQYIDTINKGNINRKGLINKMVGRNVEIINYANIKEKSEIVLEVKNLTKRGNYKDVNFKLYKGEVLGITGLVGAGRSEMIQSIFGITNADEGEIYINGKLVDIKHTWDAISHKIAYVPENRQTQGLILDYSLEDNISLPVLKKYVNKYGVVNKKNQGEKIQKLMDKLDVRPNNKTLLAKQLSGGNQQKVVISKWLGTNAEIVIVDEPTNGVDIGAKVEIHKILRELAESGKSVIVISSELPEVMSISDRILVMRRGKISGEFINNGLTQEMIMDKAVANN
ncbi:sugar ABC transporter ATP-binding protein [Oceanivirga salmonicida]|uniref:sugar ABC transporter ATP-binding protein n=1 Tax=Oceanivirga salmonicida TaxID=1769291 RepID=UPI00082AF2E6|nr:sugar ABC transporter ATP-binding protein [Oceanivirga salmonicida]